MNHGKISLFGNFGTHNLGNECTLQAVIHNVRKHLPGVPVDCICSDPEDVSARYNIPAIPIYHHRRRNVSRSRAEAPYTNALVRLVRRVFIRVPQELLHWITAFRTLKGRKMLIMTGTGMLTDFGITPLDLHYEILKWSLAAKLRQCKVVFLSVGGSRLDHPLSRWFVKSALSLADYRSYRDRFSRDCFDSIGANTSADPIYPDLAFSFPRTKLPGSPNRNRTDRVIGVGLMDYYGKESRHETGEHVYRAYLETMAMFTGWLLSQKYTVRLFVGDVSYDKRAKHDLIEVLERDRVTYHDGQLVDEPVFSVEQLLAQLATTDMVVATRFHNVLLALLLNKPVVSIAYDPKIDAVMAEAGLAAYCQSIDDADLQKLIRKFSQLEANRETVKADLMRRVEQHCRVLDEQYAVIFEMFRTTGVATGQRISKAHPSLPSRNGRQ